MNDLSENYRKCRVCETDSGIFYNDTRTFYLCPQCSLIFTFDIPDNAYQKKHYRSQWEDSDPAFWKSQVDVLLQLIGKYNSYGKVLDFGSGSGGITKELKGRGYDVDSVDPISSGYLKEQNYSYKFNTVVAVEVVEHLPNLWEEINEIKKVLTENGIIICSTLLTNPFIDSLDAQSVFAKWWYKDDQTHVSFFCNKTLSLLSEMGNFSSVDIYEDKVFVLKR